MIGGTRSPAQAKRATPEGAARLAFCRTLYVRSPPGPLARTGRAWIAGTWVTCFFLRWPASGELQAGRRLGMHGRLLDDVLLGLAACLTGLVRDVLGRLVRRAWPACATCLAGLCFVLAGRDRRRGRGGRDDRDDRRRRRGRRRGRGRGARRRRRRAGSASGGRRRSRRRVRRRVHRRRRGADLEHDVVGVGEVALAGDAVDRVGGDRDIQRARQGERAGQVELDGVAVDPGEAGGMDRGSRVVGRAREHQVGGVDRCSD